MARHSLYKARATALEVQTSSIRVQRVHDLKKEAGCPIAALPRDCCLRFTEFHLPTTPLPNLASTSRMEALTSVETQTSVCEPWVSHRELVAEALNAPDCVRHLPQSNNLSYFCKFNGWTLRVMTTLEDCVITVSCTSNRPLR